MIKIIAFILFLFIYCRSNAQLVMDNNPYIFITNGACLIVDNTSTNGIITQNPAGAGNIVSEAENNVVVWKLKTTTGNFIVPFTVTGTKIPLTINIGTAGTGSGDVVFSTYNTNPDNTIYPAAVTNMNSMTGSDNSLSALDRFWIIDAANYTTKPALNSIIFTYRDNEHASPNTITELNLKAQRYNTSINDWESLVFLDGTDNDVANTVTTGIVSVANFFKHWTLVDYTNPLPVELLSFSADCREDKVILNWTTASETNNNYFTIEKSSDAVSWEILTLVAGAGNSNTPEYYSATDNQPFIGITYYRLKQTDFDGNYTYSSVISASCSDSSPFSVQVLSLNASNELQMNFNSEEAETFVFSLYDMRGRQLLSKSFNAVSGANEIHINLNDVSEGLYIIALQNSKKFFGQKILLK
ncbi:MAG: T9SS type A sorting domain-containing protein [Bacteroidota bacterium]